jgi:hypothetical protein
MPRIINPFMSQYNMTDMITTFEEQQVKMANGSDQLFN